MTAVAQLRVLQTLVFWLQQPIWPEKVKISREQAFAFIVNLAPSLGVGIDPANIDKLKQDPNFLAQVALKISQLLLEGQTASIPPNLKELVAEYEKHLTESQIAETQKIIQARIKQLTEKTTPSSPEVKKLLLKLFIPLWTKP